MNGAQSQQMAQTQAYLAMLEAATAFASRGEGYDGGVMPGSDDVCPNYLGQAGGGGYAEMLQVGETLRMAARNGMAGPPGLAAPAGPHAAQTRQVRINDFQHPAPSPQDAGFPQPHLRRHDASGERLQTVLQDMQGEDPRCVLVTRRINKLGFKSNAILRRYFSMYGPVRDVLVPHSKVRPLGDDGTGALRRRPGNFGIVVMRHMESAQQVLGVGTDHVIEGVPITVLPFVPPKANHPSHGEHAAQNGTQFEQECWDLNAEEFEMKRLTTDSTVATTADEREWSSGSTTTSVPTSKVVSELSVALHQLDGIIREAEVRPLDARASARAAGLGRQAQEYLSSLETQCKGAVAELARSQYPAGGPPGLLGPPPPGTWPRHPAPWGPPPPAGCNSELEAISAARASLAGQAAQLMEAAARAMQLIATSQAMMVAQPNGMTGPAVHQQANAYGMAGPAVHQQAAGGRPWPGTGAAPQVDPGSCQTLRAHLIELRQEDPRCIIAVRGVKKLGLRSREVLTQHLSQYGKVLRVLVAQTKVKLHRGALMRHRPGSLGLVLMESPEVVEHILSLGEEHVVAGCHRVTFKPFSRPEAGDEEQLEAEE